MYDRLVSAVLNASYSINKNRDGVGYQILSNDIDYFIPAQKSQEPIKKLEKLIAGIRSDDYEYFLKPLTKEFQALKDYQEYYKYLEKRYRKYISMSKSSRKKKKKEGIEGRKKTFDDILNLYNRLRNTKFDIVEFEQEEERVL